MKPKTNERQHAQVSLLELFPTDLSSFFHPSIICQFFLSVRINISICSSICWLSAHISCLPAFLIRKQGWITLSPVHPQGAAGVAVIWPSVERRALHYGTVNRKHFTCCGRLVSHSSMDALRVQHGGKIYTWVWTHATCWRSNIVNCAVNTENLRYASSSVGSMLTLARLHSDCDNVNMLLFEGFYVR